MRNVRNLNQNNLEVGIRNDSENAWRFFLTPVFGKILIFSIVLFLAFSFWQRKAVVMPTPYSLNLTRSEQFYVNSTDSVKRTNAVADSLLLEGKQRLSEGRLQEADRLFKMAANIAPHYQKAGEELFKLSRSEKFSEVLEQIFLRLATGKNDEAWNIFDNHAKSSRDFFVYSGEFVADSFFAFGEIASAASILQTLTKLQPENASLTIKLAGCMDKLGY